MQQLKITPSVTARTQTVEDYLRDLGKLEMISPEEETELAGRIKAGDEEAFRRLVEARPEVRPYPGIQVHLLCSLVDPPADSSGTFRPGTSYPPPAQSGWCT